MKVKLISKFLHELEDTKAKLCLAEGLQDLALFNIQIEHLRTIEVKLSGFPEYVKLFHVRYGDGHCSCSLQEHVRRYRIDAERRGVVHRLVWM